jgi:hypothetical protein
MHRALVPARWQNHQGSLGAAAGDVVGASRLCDPSLVEYTCNAITPLPRIRRMLHRSTTHGHSVLFPTTSSYPSLRSTARDPCPIASESASSAASASTSEESENQVLPDRSSSTALSSCQRLRQTDVSNRRARERRMERQLPQRLICFRPRRILSRA